MKAILTSVMFGALLAISGVALAAAPEADPVLGTWTLNVGKSKMGGSQVFKSQTRTYTQSADGLTLNVKGVGADGKEVTTKTTYKFDGKDYPVSGVPDYDTLSGKQVNSHTAEFTMKKAGKVVGSTSRSVSKDGKTLTATASGTNAKGEKYQSVQVFDKQ